MLPDLADENSVTGERPIFTSKDKESRVESIGYCRCGPGVAQVHCRVGPG